jgi:hypothetical protein
VATTRASQKSTSSLLTITQATNYHALPDLGSSVVSYLDRRYCQTLCLAKHQILACHRCFFPRGSWTNTPPLSTVYTLDIWAPACPFAYQALRILPPKFAPQFAVTDLGNLTVSLSLLYCARGCRAYNENLNTFFWGATRRWHSMLVAKWCVRGRNEEDMLEWLTTLEFWQILLLPMGRYAI